METVVVFGGWVTILGSVNVDVERCLVDDNEHLRFFRGGSEMGWSSESDSDEDEKFGKEEEWGMDGVFICETSSFSESEDEWIGADVDVKPWNCNSMANLDKEDWFLCVDEDEGESKFVEVDVLDLSE